jgi:hypothetical protein
MLRMVPLRAGKPATTVLSLAAKGTPSSIDRGLPAFQRSRDCSASLSVFFTNTPAPMVLSHLPVYDVLFVLQHMAAT